MRLYLSLHPAVFFLLVVVLVSGGLAACQAPVPIKLTSTPRTSPTLTQTPDELATYTLAPLEPPVAASRPSRTPPTGQKKTPTPESISLTELTQTPPKPYPPEHHIPSIHGHRQFFELGCETSAAVDWAAFFGVTINEFNFQYDLPLSDNPDKGFVGDVHGPWGQIPPYAYGVNAGPVAALLRSYGLPAQAYKNYTLDEIKIQIARDQPVITWVIGNVVGGRPTEYTDSEGDTVIVAAYEHVIIVTGYNEQTGRVRYLNNGNFYEVPEDVFLNSWGILENMVVVHE
jgi:uncharacterized protein YvpB